jgi:2-keto-3-deoxy-L-rhamnonate aldolase RhmA
VSDTRPPYRDLRRRLLAGEHLLGTFVKTPTSHATEMLGLLGFDFVVFDKEHAPLGHAALDVMILAARASNITPIVRVGDHGIPDILSVLDCGALGVLVPHVSTPEKAREIAAACRYRGGTRGFANTTRAGEFGGLSFREHMDRSDDEIACIAMIEDLSAIPVIDEILAVDGIDAIFIGRGDLTAALGAPSMTSPETQAVAEKVLAAARRVDKRVIMLSPDREDALAMARLGATAFLVSSDHGFMRSAAAAALKTFAAPLV